MAFVKSVRSRTGYACMVMGRFRLRMECNKNIHKSTFQRHYSQNSPPDTFSELCAEQLKQMRRHSLYTTESQYRTIVNNVKEPHVKFSHHLRSLVDFTSMDHLGLQTNTEILNAFNKGLVEDAIGEKREYKRGFKLVLESEIANFHQRPACVFYNHAPDVLRILVKALNSADDVIFYEGANEHASYIMSSSVAETVGFSCRDLAELSINLKMSRDRRHRMILLDSIFPKKGEMAPISDIVQLAEDHECLFVVDDTYGIGIIGNELRGSDEFLPETHRPFLLTKTFDHSVGTNMCGYIVGPKNLLDHISKLDLIQEHLDVPISVMAVAMKTVSMWMSAEMKQSSRTVCGMANHIRQNLKTAGFSTDCSHLPIVSIRVGNENLLDDLLDQLQDAGMLCIGSKYPDVPMGESRLVLSVNMHHTAELIDSALKKILKIGSRLKVPMI